MDWTGAQLEALQQALMSAYPNKPALNRLLRFEMDLRLNAIAGGSNYTDTVFSLIEALEAQGRLPELVSAARRKNLGNPRLKAFVESLYANGIQPSSASRQGPAFEWRGPTDERQLEGILPIRRSAMTFDMRFIQGASKPAQSVCRIELAEEPIGTGFLIASSLLLTNYHVIAPFEESDPHELLGQIVLRFGYLTPQISQGPIGQTFRLAPDPLLKFSTVDQGLDYALLQVEDKIQSAVGLSHISFRPGRLPNPDTNIHILQHPEGQTMRLTVGNNGITGVYERDGLVQYVSDTAIGSSGSPCFNDSWELVSIHHAQVAATFGVKSEGILVEAIHRDIAEILSQHVKP